MGEPATRLPWPKFGVGLPLLLFIAAQFALVWSLDGGGGFDGMGVVLVTVVMLPTLAIANCWVGYRAWSRRATLFLAGLALPAVVVLTEHLWLHVYATRQVINQAFVAPFPWLWGFGLALFLPLILMAYRARRR